MANAAIVSPSLNDSKLVSLAREIAMDIAPLETILEGASITPEQWEIISQSGRFKSLLAAEAEAWNTALNTHERVKLKAAAMMEEWLPELNSRLHDRGENLTAKIEGGKLLAKIASVGERVMGDGDGGGERFSVTINLGADTQLKFEKELPAKVIEHEPLD